MVKPLLKFFGEGGDSRTQVATDKAVNARRASTASVDAIQSAAALAGANSDYVSTLSGATNPANGELVVHSMTAAANAVPHSLGRVPAGAFVVYSADKNWFICTALTSDYAQVETGASSGFPFPISVWIF